MEKGVVLVKPAQRIIDVSSGAMTREVGVSASTAGSSGIFMVLATIPPGQCSSPHWHTNCESAIYVLRGHGLFMVGSDLNEALAIGPGDCIYVPPGAIHQPINQGTEPLELVVARNTQEEIVVEYDPALAGGSG